MPGRLRCDELDFNDAQVVHRVIVALRRLALAPESSYPLKVCKRYYFSVPGGLPTGAGWYVIGDAQTSLYVGTADNLDARLNSGNGSRDQFANPQRTSDPERNFIKAFVAGGVLGPLRVTVIPESSLCAALGMAGPLTRRDRHNVEKVLNLFRERVMARVTPHDDCHVRALK